MTIVADFVMRMHAESVKAVGLELGFQRNIGVGVVQRPGVRQRGSAVQGGPSCPAGAETGKQAH